MMSLFFGLMLACTATEVPATDTEPTGTTDTDTGEPQAAEGALWGSLTDTSGAPVSARVSMCLGICYTVFSDEDGRYVFPAIEEGTWSFEVVPVDETLATVLTPLPRTEEEERQLDVVVPFLGESQPIPASAAPVEVLEGLTLTVGEDNLEPPLATTLGDISGVAVDEEHWPPLETLEGEVFALFYLDPFEAHATEEGGVAIEVDNAWELAPGTEVEVWAASYTDFAFLAGGTLTVSADGSTLTGEEAGVPVLSTLVLLLP